MRLAVRICVRRWRRTAVLVLVLAIAAGATGALSAVLNSWLFGTGPVREPASLAVLYTFNRRTGAYGMLSYPLYRFITGAARGVSVSAYSRVLVPVTVNHFTQGVWAELVSPSYFRTLGIVVAGPGFAQIPCAPQSLAVVSKTFAHLQGKTEAVVAGRTFAIVGDVPPQFAGVQENWDGRPMMWFPLCDQPWLLPMHPPVSLLNATRVPWLLAVARRPAHMNSAAFAALLQLVSRHAVLAGLLPRGSEVLAVPYPAGRLWPALRPKVVGAARLLSAGVGWLLLIAFVNAASLFAAILLTRRTDIATAQAMGASTWRTVSESIHLGLFAATLAALPSMLITWALVRLQWAIGGFFLLRLPQPAVLSPRSAGLALVADFALAIITVILALMITGSLRSNLSADLAGGVQRAGRRLGTHHIFLAVQVASAACLLTWAGALAYSYVRLAGQAPGFRPGGIKVATVTTAYQVRKNDDSLVIYQRLLTQAKSRGYEAVLAESFPGFPARLSGEVKAPAGSSWTRVRLNAVSPGFFAALQITVIYGRPFGRRDTIKTEPVAVVNSVLARTMWPHGLAVGRVIRVRGVARPERVIGVVSNIRFNGYGTAGPALYLPILQNPVDQVQLGLINAPPGSVRRLAAAVDPKLLVYNIRTLRDQLAAQLRRPRTVAISVGTYSLLATLVCFAGVIALTFLIVGAGRREFAIRASLGAYPVSVAAGAMRSVLFACCCGAAAGGAVAEITSQRVLGGLVGGGALIFAISSAICFICVPGCIAFLLAYRDASHADLASLLREGA